MTLLEIIFAIREKLKAYTDDTRYTDDYLYYLVNLKRNMLLRREYNLAQRSIDEETLSVICLEMEHVDASECPECTISDRCEVFRTIKQLPNFVELHSRNTITRVAPIGIGSKPISLVSSSRILYVGDEPYEKNIIYAFKHPNRHIYLKSQNGFYNTLEYITVTGLVENPLDLVNYSCDTNGTPCFDSETVKYPVKAWMVDVIISMIVQELANLKQLPEDRLNDGKENI